MKKNINPCVCGAQPSLRLKLLTFSPYPMSYMVYWIECPACGRKTRNTTKEKHAIYEWNEDTGIGPIKGGK